MHVACSVGAPCSSGQRLTVKVGSPLAVEGIEDRESVAGGLPASEYELGALPLECINYRSGVQLEGLSFRESNAARSRCSDPIPGDNGRMHVRCLSGPATMTPGGVITRSGQCTTRTRRQEGGRGGADVGVCER